MQGERVTFCLRDSELMAGLRLCGQCPHAALNIAERTARQIFNGRYKLEAFVGHVSRPNKVAGRVRNPARVALTAINGRVLLPPSARDRATLSTSTNLLFGHTP